jgi:predicted GNAT family N-acyltransferase
MKEAIEVKIIQDAHQLDAAMEIRKKVFQEEQGIDQSLDFDGKDEHSDHFVAYKEKTAIGTGRLRYSFDGRKIAKVERMAVLKEFRGKGVGRQMIEAMHDYLKSKDVSDIKLDAQEGVKGFYEKMGYEQNGEVFVEVGLPHVQMVKQL